MEDLLDQPRDHKISSEPGTFLVVQMTESDTEEVKCVGPLPESETNQIEEEEQKDQSDHGSIYASSSVSGFTNSSLPRRKIIHVETGTCRLNS